MKASEKQRKNTVLKISEHKRKRADELEADIDVLFGLPLAEFTGARNAMAAQLKKSGRGDEAARVKALAKPPISAWAVNQLYWNHREAFDELIASGEQFHKAQTSGKVANMRAALDARRDALTQLTARASSSLRDAGQNPSPDTILRITTTLEALSVHASASRSDGPRPGRLTRDVDPPGFESLGGFVPSTGVQKQESGARRQPAVTSTRFTGSRESSAATAGKSKNDARKLEETRKTKIAEAKVSLQEAKRSLTQARAKAQSLDAAQKWADTEARKAERQSREAEENLQKAKAASENAARRARSVAVEVEGAASAVEDAESAVEKASKELEAMSRES